MNDIIQEIRRGNKDAVKAVYQKYAKDVYNFAKSITGDHDSALFATKKTFSILFTNIKKGDEPANLRTAALKIAYDEAYNAATAQKSADSSTDAYAESESPANKTYLKPKKVEDNTVQYQDAYSSYNNSYDEYNDSSVGNSSSRRQPSYQNNSYNDGYDDGYNDGYDDDYNDSYQNDYDNYDDYDEPKTKKSKCNKKIKSVYNDAQYDDDYYDDDYEDERPKHRNKGLFIFCIVINVVLILILLWFLCGLLINLGILPSVNLGYTWFNNAIYPLF